MSDLPLVMFMVLSLVAGGLLPVQAGANAQLSAAVGSPFAATTVQLLIAAFLLVTSAGIAGSLSALTALSDVAWWHAIGGLASALYVVAGIVLFPRLGAVVAVGLLIAGQILASVGLDASGALGVAPQEFTVAMLAGTAAVLVAAFAIVRGQSSGETGRRIADRLAWVLLALVAGAILPIQGAINALLRTDLGAPLAVGVTSFVVATLGMAIVAVLALIFWGQSRPRFGGLAHLPWWGWLGGFVGAFYVVTVFTALPAIGTAATIGLTIVGQQLVSVVIDRQGLLRLPKRPLSNLRLAGVALLSVGVGLILVN